MSIRIRLNGDAKELEEGLTVAALLQRLDIKAQRVVVEHNQRILRAEQFDGATIAEGDELEVLQFVGGG